MTGTTATEDWLLTCNTYKTNLRSVSEILIHKAWIWVVLNVFPFNEVFQMIQGLTRSVLELKNGHLKNVHLHPKIQEENYQVWKSFQIMNNSENFNTSIDFEKILPCFLCSKPSAILNYINSKILNARV